MEGYPPPPQSPVQHMGAPSPHPGIYQPSPQMTPSPVPYQDTMKQYPAPGVSAQPQQYVPPMASPPPQQPAPTYTTAPANAAVYTTMGTGAHGSNLSPWSSAIFDCFNPAESCFMACFCPCVVFGKTRARLRDPSLASYDTVNSECAIWSALSLCGFSCIYQWISRKEIRNRYALKGDDIEDAVWTMCCPVCALVQEEKEVILRTTGAQAAPPVQMVGYVPQTQMQMQMQHH